MEIGFDKLSAAAGLFVVAMALRVASSFTLSAHRQAMRVLACTAVVVVASEIIRIGAALTRSSSFTDAAGEFAELVATSSAGPCCTTSIGWSGRRSLPSGAPRT
jgi:hypothetical protein